VGEVLMDHGVMLPVKRFGVCPGGPAIAINTADGTLFRKYYGIDDASICQETLAFVGT